GKKKKCSSLLSSLCPLCLCGESSYHIRMPPDQAYTDLIRRVREASLLSSCAGVLGWDERTYMPRAGAAHRGEQMALLARLAHERMTAPALGELLAKVEASELVRDPDSEAAANVREVRRGL